MGLNIEAFVPVIQQSTDPERGGTMRGAGLAIKAAPADSPVWRNLLAGIILQAMKDAGNGNPYLAARARHWLAGTGAGLAEDWLDVPEERLMTWMRDLDPLPWEKIAYFLLDVVAEQRARLAEAEAGGHLDDGPGGGDGATG
jgi:hypothetical protein